MYVKSSLLFLTGPVYMFTQKMRENIYRFFNTFGSVKILLMKLVLLFLSHRQHENCFLFKFWMRWLITFH